MKNALTKREKTVYDKVTAYRKKHGGSISTACEQVDLPAATYYNATKKLKGATAPKTILIKAKRKYAKRTPKVFDVPTPKSTSKVAVIVCDPHAVGDIIASMEG